MPILLPSIDCLFAHAFTDGDWTYDPQFTGPATQVPPVLQFQTTFRSHTCRIPQSAQIPPVSKEFRYTCRIFISHQSRPSRCFPAIPSYLLHPRQLFAMASQPALIDAVSALYVSRTGHLSVEADCSSLCIQADRTVLHIRYVW